MILACAEVLPFVADQEHHVSHRIIAGYLNAGSTAVSEIKGKEKSPASFKNR